MPDPEKIWQDARKRFERAVEGVPSKKKLGRWLTDAAKAIEQVVEIRYDPREHERDTKLIEQFRKQLEAEEALEEKRLRAEAEKLMDHFKDLANQRLREPDVDPEEVDRELLDKHKKLDQGVKLSLQQKNEQNRRRLNKELQEAQAASLDGLLMQFRKCLAGWEKVYDAGMRELETARRSNDFADVYKAALPILGKALQAVNEEFSGWVKDFRQVRHHHGALDQ